MRVWFNIPLADYCGRLSPYNHRILKHHSFKARLTCWPLKILPDTDTPHRDSLVRHHLPPYSHAGGGHLFVSDGKRFISVQRRQRWKQRKIATNTRLSNVKVAMILRYPMRSLAVDEIRAGGKRGGGSPYSRYLLPNLPYQEI